MREDSQEKYSFSNKETAPGLEDNRSQSSLSRLFCKK